MNPSWMTPELTQRFAGSLLHFVWQGAVIALVTAGVLRAMRHRSAEARYAFASCALLCMLLAPIFTVAFYAETGAVSRRLILALSQAPGEGRAAAVGFETALWAQRILLAWCAGVMMFGVRMVVGWRLSWQLVRSAEAILVPGLAQLFENVCEHLRLRRPIRLLVHARIDSPIVVGWLRPVVLLPVSLITGVSMEQLSAILAHELAHVRRHDFLVNILQRCVESILFYHPAVWWLSKRIRSERENCCDDIAVRLCGSRRIYAQALLEMERARQPRPILAVAGADGVVLQRFRRVLGLRTSVMDWQSAVSTLVVVGVWIVVGTWQSEPASAAKPAVVAAAILPTSAAPESAVQTVNAIAAILTAQPVEPAPTTQAAAPLGVSKGTIQGTVTRAGSSEPIPGAFVAITNAPFDPDALKTLLAFWANRGITMDPQEPGQADEKYFQTLLDKINARGISVSLPENQISIMQFRQSNTERYSAVADANGHYTIPDVAPGQYTLEAGRPGFFDSPGNRTTANVEAGKAANAGVPLRQGATITGRVRSSVGKVIPNAAVTAYLITYLNGKIIPQAQASQTTDDRGEYRLFWLPPGDYVLLADPPRYPVSPVPQIQVPATGLGQGAAPAQVTLATPPFMRSFYPQGLTTTDARILPVKGGDQLSGMDITVQKATAYKISGAVFAGPTVTPPQRGAPPNAPQGVQVQLGLEFRDPSVVDMRSTNLGGTVPSVGSVFLTPNENGSRATFELRDILPGEYYIVPRTLFGPINRIPVNVRDRDVTDLVMEVFTSVNVDGTLTVDGRPPGNITARVALNAVGNPSPTYQGVTARAVIAKADDGTFTIPNIPPTRYLVEMGTGLPPDLYVADVRAGAMSVFDSGIEVGKEPPAPLQVLLRSGAAKVDGVVRDGTGKPISNATVVLVPPEARRENRQLYKSGKSDASGNFVVRGIAPGNYKIFAFQGIAGGEFYNSRFLSKYEFRGKSITLSQGGSATETLTIIEQ